MEKIYLSLEESEKILPLIRKKLKKLMDINKALSLLNSIDLRYEDEHETLIQDIKINKKFHKLSYDFYNLMDELHSKGCIIRDLDQGIVDFYSFFEGREIFFCWSANEKKINYWHELDCGRDCKRPVSIIRHKISRPKKEFFIK